MKGSKFILVLSVIEVFRWIIIYLFLNFVKVNFIPGEIISGEGWLWFGMTFTANIMFATGGILSFFNSQRYYIMLRFWAVFKLLFLFFIIFLLFYGRLSFLFYLFIGTPFDLLLILFIFLRIKTPEEQV